MHPVEFPTFNTTFAANQPEYLPLPAHYDDVQSIVTTCWKLTRWERLRLLVTGRVWAQQMTFGRPLQPQLLLSRSPFRRIAGHWFVRGRPSPPPLPENSSL